MFQLILSNNLFLKLERPSRKFSSSKFKHLLHNSKIQNVINSFSIFEIKTKAQCQEACDILNSHCQELSALGFDCEWVSRTKVQRPVSLLQLASPHGLCCLFRLNILEEIPSDLEKILNNEKIVKLGVSTFTDTKILKHDFKVEVKSTLDLRHLYSKHVSLANLADSIIGVKLDKKSKLQMSNWENLELTDGQKEYAAKDALVAIEIFKNWLLSDTEKEFSSNELLVQYCSLVYKKYQKRLETVLDLDYKANS